MSKPTHRQTTDPSDSPSRHRRTSMFALLSDLVVAREAQAVRRAKPYLVLFGHGDAVSTDGARNNARGR